MRMETQRLILRNMEESDLERFDALFNTDFVTRYLCMEQMTRQECLDYIRQMMVTHKDIAIALKGSNAFIGKIHMDRDDLRFGVNSVSLAYWLGEPYARQGYMTEALQAFLPWLFQEKGYDIVSAQVLSPNTDSATLLTRLGFTQEGCIRRALAWQGTVYDSMSYSLLKEEWL